MQYVCKCSQYLGTTTPSLTTNSGGCFEPDWVGDDYCDDGNNNQECNYDGGDCCGPNVNTQYCTECQCLSDGGYDPFPSKERMIAKFAW